MRWGRRIVPLTLAALALAWAGAAPADDPEVPERYIKVDEAKAMLDARRPVTFVDVRPREQYDVLHIKGAMNVPLEELAKRLDEVPRQPFVIVY